MHRFAPVALATLLAATAPAQIQAHTSAATFTDPANLRGERVRPRDGRELPIDTGALGLQQLLRKLNTRASLMLIVAHPDDEDGGLLTFYSRGLGARVAILTLNRGEGGMNAMTGDLEDALGLLRTQELLAADRYMGVDQFFGTEVDFGFSKTKEEAFKKWGHDRVLYDAVRAVRIYRPLVIASVFEGAVTDGHGQHQVSGQIAQEVFKAAGDPNVFPELTREGILPWQPLKVYARVPFSRVTDKGLFDYATGQVVPAQFTNYVTGQTFTTTPSADVTINEGQTDPLLTFAATNLSDLRTKPSNLNEQLSYVQFARIGLGLQRSQIGAGMRIPPAGRSEVSYHLYGSRVCAPKLPNPTPDLCHPNTATSRHDTGWPILSQSERVGYRAARDKTSSAHLEPASFTTSASDNPALAHDPTFFDGIDTSLSGIATLAAGAKNDVLVFLKASLSDIDREIEAAQKEVSAGRSESSTCHLGSALYLTDKLIKNLAGVKPDELPSDESENIFHELAIKRAQLSEAISFALGLQLNATAQNANLLSGSKATVTATLTDTSRQSLQGVQCGLRNAQEKLALGSPLSHEQNKELASGKPLVQTLQGDLGLTGFISRPYFFRKNIGQSVYMLRNPALRNAPSTPPALTAWCGFTYQGSELEIAHVVTAADQPVAFVPPLSVALSSNAQVVPSALPSFKVTMSIAPPEHPIREAHLSKAATWGVRPPSVSEFAHGKADFEIKPSTGPRTQTTLEAQVKSPDGTTYTEGFRPVGYGTLPRTNDYTPATLHIVPVDLRLPPANKRRIAYLPGTGDDVPAALASIGLTPTILTVSDLTPANLAKYDTVILGVRTYNAHPDLHGAPTQALLDFARSGGNVVVQYQTEYLPNEFTSADTPYPLSLDGERVIDETAPVKVLDAGSPLMTSPNKITPADFNGWIEERGHGFLDSWDSHYTALTETHDPGAPAEHIADQTPQRGGLVTTPLGKGRWTYCAFALYRQLPEAVPGAFRLFVNLLTP